MSDERARQVDLGVSIDAGAPLPHLIADGHRAIVIFHAGFAPDPDGDSSSIVVVDPTTHDSRSLGWVIFDGVSHISIGHPNDEALHGHPLYGKGLTFYEAHEVDNSALLAALEAANSVHPHHQPGTFAAQRHVIITFHDETLECVCNTWSSGHFDADFPSALTKAMTALQTGTME